MARPVLGPDEFTAALSRHGRSLWVLGAAWVGRVDAADLVQETARVAWERRNRFRPGTDERAWLAQIARHVGSNWRRRRRPRATGPDELPEPPAREAVAEPTSFDADRLGLPDGLARGLASLSEVARACLLLHIVMEHTAAEIACMLDIPENTVASHVRRARLALREALKTREPSEAT